MKRRIDQLLVERGYAESRHKAQALLMAGQVLVKEKKIEKPGQLVEADADVRLLRQLRFASRAGAKLQAALDQFNISVAGRVCADLGASTGGFTDCLLQNGAARVYAFDVGKGQLAWKLQGDARVVVHDEYNVRMLRPADIPGGLSFICIDLSFISVTKVLLPLRDALCCSERQHAGQPVPPVIDIVILVKPQFEAGKGEVGKGGVVRDPVRRNRALEGVSTYAAQNGFQVMGNMQSPIAGTHGNMEFLLYLIYSKS
ncbi:MAG TPA: TlyA family RNA methyltransferase [Acidobacteriota bacterium]|nr:TlyA family RNA methyltransferase [Acidobacteriota bacterium]